MNESNFYAVVLDRRDGTIYNTQFFSTRPKAQAKLREIANARRNMPGVHVHTDTNNMFAFRLGWEEAEVMFRIVELKMDVE